MPPVGSFLSAKGARARVSGTNLYKADYDAERKTDKLDTTNYESGGFDQSTIGVVGCDWNLRGLWATGGNQQFDDPPGLYPRDDLGLTSLYHSVSQNILWQFPQSTVLSAKVNAPVRETVKFEVSACSNGNFSVPSG